MDRVLLPDSEKLKEKNVDFLSGLKSALVQSAAAAEKTTTTTATKPTKMAASPTTTELFSKFPLWLRLELSLKCCLS